MTPRGARGLWRDDRGISIGIARFFLSLIVGAVMIFIVATVTDPILSRAETGSDGTAAAPGTGWLQQGIDFMPVLFVLVAGFGLVAYAVFRRQVV